MQTVNPEISIYCSLINFQILNSIIQFNGNLKRKNRYLVDLYRNDPHKHLRVHSINLFQT